MRNSLSKIANPTTESHLTISNGQIQSDSGPPFFLVLDSSFRKDWYFGACLSAPKGGRENDMSAPTEAGNVLLDLVQTMQERRSTHTSKPNLTGLCEHPDIGQLIKALGCTFLVETLELEQGIFASEYPELASFGEDVRRNMSTIVRQHVQECPKCQLEAAEEEKWNDSFSEFLKNETHVVKEILKNKRRISRGKARTFKAGSG